MIGKDKTREAMSRFIVSRDQGSEITLYVIVVVTCFCTFVKTHRTYNIKSYMCPNINYDFVNKSTTLVWNFDRWGRLCVYDNGVYMSTLCTSVQFCFEPKTALK